MWILHDYFGIFHCWCYCHWRYTCFIWCSIVFYCWWGLFCPTSLWPCSFFKCIRYFVSFVCSCECHRLYYFWWYFCCFVACIYILNCTRDCFCFWNIFIQSIINISYSDFFTVNNTFNRSRSFFDSHISIRYFIICKFIRTIFFCIYIIIFCISSFFNSCYCWFNRISLHIFICNFNSSIFYIFYFNSNRSYIRLIKYFLCICFCCCWNISYLFIFCIFRNSCWY